MFRVLIKLYDQINEFSRFVYGSFFHTACSAALRRRARPFARATPATYEDVSGGARATSGVVRRTSALGAGSFWRTWRPR